MKYINQIVFLLSLFITCFSNAMTPLHFAALDGNLMEVKRFLDKGANVNADIGKGGTLAGLTPLHMAASKGHEDVAKLLLDRGAKVNAADNDGLTPLDVAELTPYHNTAELIDGRKKVATLLRNWIKQ